MEIVFRFERWVSDPVGPNYYKLVDPITKIEELIIEDGGLYFYLKEEKDKLNEIINMPSYIKDDWFKYHREELTIKQIDKIVQSIENEHQKEQVKYAYNIPYRVDLEEKLQKLKSVRRDLVIKKI